jgi:hypothetical protein
MSFAFKGLILPLDVRKWSASRPGHFAPEEDTAVPIGLEAAWDPGSCGEEKILWPCQKSNPGRPALSLVTILTELSRLILVTVSQQI